MNLVYLHTNKTTSGKSPMPLLYSQFNKQIMNTKTKVCIKCKKEKPLTEFNSHLTAKDRLDGRCKTCISEYYVSYRRTVKGLITIVYNTQVMKSKERGHPIPSYTKQELSNWIETRPNFHALYDTWVFSGYDTSLKPSCDRLKNNLPYSLDNLQLVTWNENNKNGHISKSKPVIGTHKKTKEHIEFYSIMEAARQTEISQSSISNCCLCNLKSAGGYVWKYKI